MKKLLLATAILGISVAAGAQQLHFSSQYLRHNPMYNPGASGIAGYDMIGVSYRNQWNSFPGSPKTYFAHGDFNVERMGAGASAYVYKDETGATSRTGAQLGLSKHIVARNGKSRFGIGLEFRGVQYAIDRDKIVDALTEQDPVLLGVDKKFTFDAGAGVYYAGERLSLGVAAQQLIGSKIELNNIPEAGQDGRLYRHYNAMASYKIPCGDSIYLIPNARLIMVENSPNTYEVGAFLNYKEKVWWGLGHRFDQSWILQAGFRLFNHISFNYSYDYFRSPIDVFTKGSGAHEVGLRFEFNKK